MPVSIVELSLPKGLITAQDRMRMVTLGLSVIGTNVAIGTAPVQLIDVVISGWCAGDTLPLAFTVPGLPNELSSGVVAVKKRALDAVALFTAGISLDNPGTQQLDDSYTAAVSALITPAQSSLLLPPLGYWLSARLTDIAGFIWTVAVGVLLPTPGGPVA